VPERTGRALHRVLEELLRNFLGCLQVRLPIVKAGERNVAARASSGWLPFPHQELAMLTVGMVVLGLATFAAMMAFVELCDHV
jgi:hypothetical protein